MAIVVNDPRNFPLRMAQRSLSEFGNLTEPFLDDLIKHNGALVGCKRTVEEGYASNYYMINTQGLIHVSVMTPQVKFYLQVMEGAQMNGIDTLMITLNKSDDKE